MSVADLKARLEAYRTIELEILEKGQSIGADGDVYTRASLSTITKMIERLEARLAVAEGSGYGHGNVVFGRRA